VKTATLVVFVDAFGERELPLLADRFPRLQARVVDGILGYSSGALPTILTGQSPATHGRMCLYAGFRGPGSSPLAPLGLLGLVPRIIRHRPRIAGWIGRAWNAARGHDGYFSLARVPPALYRRLETPEDRDLFAAPSIGGQVTFLEEARQAGLRVTATDFRAPERIRATAIERAPDADLAFLYLAGLDASLHASGRIDRAATAWAEFAAAAITRSRLALARAGGGRTVRVLIVGDHGMAPIEATVDPRATTAALQALAGDPLVFVDATMIRVWVRVDRRAAATTLLEALGARVLDADALATRGAPSDGSYGDLVGLLPEGTMFAPSFLGGAVRGMHGYDRGTRSSRAALLGDVGGIAEARELTDVADLVRTSLGFSTGVAA
jgi:hypothetical protein